MPHCILEYTDNILDKIDNQVILKNIHDVLTSTKLFSLNDIKSRVNIHHEYFIGDGDPVRAFVALTISILTGRDKHIKAIISKNCSNVLKEYFKKSQEKLKLSITVHIQEMDKETYNREVNY